MNVMYIAASHTKSSGHFLGDVLLEIRLAWEWWRRETPDETILSLHTEEKELNFLWDAFIETVKPTIIWDSFDASNRDLRWSIFDNRRKTRQVNGLDFHIYKELYPRLDGGPRQSALCGRERGLGKRNILEYYWFGQESYQPGGIIGFGVGILKEIRMQRQPQILIAPHEKCQGNKVFTLNFWCRVIQELSYNIPLLVNTPHPHLFPQEKNIQYIFPSYQGLLEQLAASSLVVCGNTGVGWAAGAVGTPVVACESPDMAFWEYSYRRTGLATLVATIEHPNVPWCVAKILDEWKNAI